MKTSLWKILLVLAAVIIGAALLVPKALRDKTERGAPVTAAAQSATDVKFDKPATLISYGVVDVETDIVGPYISNIGEAMCGGLGSIIDRFTVKEARDFVLALNAGTIPAKMRPVD